MILTGLCKIGTIWIILGCNFFIADHRNDMKSYENRENKVDFVSGI